MAIRAITLDFWDTIYHDDPIRDEVRKRYRFHVIRQALSQLGHKVGTEPLRGAIGYAAQLSRHEWDVNHRTPSAKERLLLALSHLDMSLAEPELDKLALQIEEIGFEYPPLLFAESRKAIEQLADVYDLALISDTGLTSGKVLRKVLQRDGLLDYFKVLTFSDEAGASKPDEKVFESTMQELGVSREEVIHVGDSETKDVAGAIGAGIRVIHLAREHSRTYGGDLRYERVEGIGHVYHFLDSRTVGC